MSRANGTEGIISKLSSSLFEELLQSYDATNSACSAIDRLQQKFSFSSLFSLETLFPSAKINPVKSVRNRITSMGKCLLFA